MNTYNLEARHDSRKSFYGKAVVYNDSFGKVLYSYLTPVASVNSEGVTLYNTNLYSQTTFRHVREFLKQEGYKADNRKQVFQDYL